MDTHIYVYVVSIHSLSLLRQAKTVSPNSSSGPVICMTFINVSDLILQ